MTDEMLRIRGYLTAQGAKLTPSAIVEKVQAAMADLRAAAVSVPPARFGERPAPDDWSGNEVMAHVVTAGAYCSRAIVNILDGRPVPPPMRGQSADPGRPDVEGPLSRTAEAWLETLEGDRRVLFERALAADPAACPDGRMEHSFFGPLTWRETLLFLRLHDLDHAGQLIRIAAALA
jgi:hypothetical protein